MKKIKQNKFDISAAFLDLQQAMSQELITDRTHIKHPVSKGNATEFKWIETFRKYLPNRYSVDKAFVIDCKGNISDEIDMIIYDQQYSPFLFNRDTSLFIPAESVYAVLEIKQDLNKTHIEYAGRKASSVRLLYRTSAPVPYVEGKLKCKPLHEIIAGILTLTSSWKDPFGRGFISAIKKSKPEERIDIGCVLEQGAFEIKYESDGNEKSNIIPKDKALIFFFLKLLSKLQSIGTCPAIEIGSYSKYIFDDKKW